MPIFRVIAIASLCALSPVMAADGLVAVKSSMSVQDTADRFSSVLEAKGVTLFARIDHADGAERAGQTLRPTELFIFGNPAQGTPFMHCAQTVAIDLPLKVLVWEDALSQVWIGYNHPDHLTARHDAEDCPAVDTLAHAIKRLVEDTLVREPPKPAPR